MAATHFMMSTLLVAIDISKHRHEVLIGIVLSALVVWLYQLRCNQLHLMSKRGE